MVNHNHTLIIALISAAATGCTGVPPGAVLLQQQQETFSSQLQFNTEIDMLWVVDNSSSMDVDQMKLRNGFTAFAQKYMLPTWDIHVAVITTDTYLANPAFQTWLGPTVPGTTGYKSAYIGSRLGTFVNPPGNPTLVNLITGAFDSGVKIKDLIPQWGPNYGKLSPGTHDGPVPALCFEGMPLFMGGESQCKIRDNQAAYNGSSHCLNPGTGETSVTQCVNTLENNTIHSGKAIISTQPPAGTPGDQTWVNSLINNFMVNVSTGSAGMGSERGLGSVLELIGDNESTSTAFFRQNSIRAIIFVSDEDDQTMTLPATPPAGFSPWTHYACDQASLVALNGAGPITGANSFCCSQPGCQFGAEGTSCPSKTVDGYTYTLGVCALPNQLVAVSDVKTQLDTFFNKLDGVSAGSPANYYVFSIVALAGTSIQTLATSRNQDDINAGSLRVPETDRSDRYIALGNLVGGGSTAMDITSSDYSPILDTIGGVITEKRGTFPLSRVPTGLDQMFVQVVHADGTQTTLSQTVYTISGNQLVITDLPTLLSLKSTDQILVNYQPNSSI